MDIQKRMDELRELINRNDAIVNGLNGNTAFTMLIEDYTKMLKQADENWHLLNLDDKDQLSRFNNLRSVKIAGMQLINILESYQYESERALAEIKQLEDKDITEEETTTTNNSYYEE